MRLLGINIPDNKKVGIALRYIYGIGPALAVRIVEMTKIDPDKRAKDLDSAEVNKIKEVIEKNFKIEGELRQVIKQNVAMLKEMGTYRGNRHMRRLPVRGQRTKPPRRPASAGCRPTAGG